MNWWYSDRSTHEGQSGGRGRNTEMGYKNIEMEIDLKGAPRYQHILPQSKDFGNAEGILTMKGA